MSTVTFITERVGYLAGVNNLGVIRGEDGAAIAVDAGIDKEAARLLRRACEQAGLRLTAVISTHHHADHVGGNDYLVRNLPGMRVYAPTREAPFIEDPYLEPMYLSQGAIPVAALKNRFVMATPAPVHERIAPGVLEVAGVTVEIVAVPGHSLAQVAVVVDGVCFAADAFFGSEVLQKYGVPYAHDVTAQIASFAVIEQLPVHTWIPGHGEREQSDTLGATLANNRAAVAHSKDLVWHACAEAAPLQTVVARVQAQLARPSTALAQYAVFASGIMAYLQHLQAEGALDVQLTEQGPFWEQRR